MKPALIIIYYALFTLAGLYFGTAGLVNSKYVEEINAIPKEELKVVIDSVSKKIVTYKYNDVIYGSIGSAKAAEIIQRVPSLYKWIFNQSDVIILLITCCFLGALGAIARIVKDKIFTPAALTPPRIAYLPVLGFFSGFIVLSISYAVPNYLTSGNEIHLNPLSVMVLCLLGGMYVELFMEWLGKLAATLFR